MNLIDTNIYYLPGTNNKFIHVGTIHRGIQEYLCMIDVQTHQCYIEEITGGHLSRIEDDSLAEEIGAYANSKKLFDIGRIGNWLARQPVIQSGNK